MTISLPGTSKLGLAGLLSKKRRETEKSSPKTRTLNPHEIAQRFSKKAPREAPMPAKLNDAEKQDRARISNLRGALYSDD